jgi:hypothetical protein
MTTTVPVYEEYQQSSQRFCSMWEQLVNKGKEVGYEIVNMIRILESNGYSRTKTIEKIVSDHTHLKGFSRMTIYGKLLDNMNHEYDDAINMLPDNSDISNKTFEQESQQLIDMNDVKSTTTDNEKPVDNLSYIQILQEKNQLLTKKLELIEKNAQLLNFLKEYVSKDNSKIQEFECPFVYKGEILPLSITLNLTTEKMSVFLDKVRCEKLNKTLNNKNKK